MTEDREHYGPKRTYKWEGPHDWLLSKAREWDAAELYSALSCVVDKVDADTLQDIFQSEMDADGYFTPEVTP